MAAYVAPEQIKRDHLTQLLGTSEHDSTLARFAQVATLFIDNDLGFSFTTATPGTGVAYGDGDTMLKLPDDYVADSLTGITTTSGYTVPDDYVERDGYLIVTTPDGGLLSSYRNRWPYHYDPFATGGVWTDGAPYTIAGDFGHGDAPDDIQWLTCEIATLLWNGKAAGGIEVVVTEAATRTIRANLSPLHRAVLDAHRVPSGFTFA